MERVVALKLPGDLFYALEANSHLDIEFGQPVIVAGGAESAHAPSTGMKKAVGALLLVTAVLKTAAAGVELAHAIEDYVSNTGESVQIAHPGTGDVIIEITRSTGN